ncbi:MAG: hypothetical protein ACLSWZ_03920 [Parabacteroides distasonis]
MKQDNNNKRALRYPLASSSLSHSHMPRGNELNTLATVRHEKILSPTFCTGTVTGATVVKFNCFILLSH